MSLNPGMAVRYLAVLTVVGLLVACGGGGSGGGTATPESSVAPTDAGGTPNADASPLTPEELQEQFDRLEALRDSIDQGEFDVAVKAQQLGPNPDAIFAFVRDEIAFEAYPGVLRGAKGTLIAKAGNSFDKSLLLAELLKANGFAVSFAEGELNDAAAQQLLDQMLEAEAPTRAADDLDEVLLTAGLTRAQWEASSEQLQSATDRAYEEIVTAADAALEAIEESLEAEGISIGDPTNLGLEAQKNNLHKHLWVMYRDHQGTEVALDPSLITANPGDTFASETAVYSEVPPTYLHTITFKVSVEKLTSDGNEMATVLEKGYPVSDLIGRDLSFDNIPNLDENDHSLSSLPKVSRFLPVLTLDGQQTTDKGFDLQGNTVPISEFLPPGLGQAVTGILEQAADAISGVTETPQESSTLGAAWLDMTYVSASGETRTYRRDLLDRVGADIRAARPTIRMSDISDAFRDEARIRYFLTRSYDVMVSPLVYSDTFDTYQMLSRGLAGRPAWLSLLAATEQAPVSPVPGMNANLLSYNRGTHVLANILASSQFSGMRFYHSAPEIVLFKAALDLHSSGEVTYEQGIDVVENQLTAVGPSGKERDAALFNLKLGVYQTALERQIVTDFVRLSTPDGGAPAARTLGTIDVCIKATEDGIDNRVIENGQRGELGDIDVVDMARARIEQEIDSGYIVLTPERSVLLEGEPRTGWWRIDPATGNTLGIGDTGEGQSAAEYAILVTASVSGVIAQVNVTNACRANGGSDAVCLGCGIAANICAAAGVLTFFIGLPAAAAELPWLVGLKSLASNSVQRGFCIAAISGGIPVCNIVAR